MTKIVINRRYGGFSLSAAACAELGCKPSEFGYDYQDRRADPQLVAVVEKLGDAANGDYARLKIVKIPDDVEWEIDEYDGMEHVAEKHRIWE